jgi:hypothetical protein
MSELESLIEGPIAVPGAIGHPETLTSWYSRSAAVDGEDIYVVYMGNDSEFSSYVIKYASADQSWTESFRLGSGGKQDQHHYPNIVMDKEGYLHAFYGAHCDPLHYRRSRWPRDISEWTPEEFPIPISTYPRPFVLADGRILVFQRSGFTRSTRYRYGYIESSDGGKTWSEFRALIDVPDNLWIPYVGGVRVEEGVGHAPTVHIGWCWFDYKKNSSDIYYEDLLYVSFPLDSEIWRGADGTQHDQPLVYEKVDPVLEGHWIYAEDMSVDDQGRPVLVFSRGGLKGGGTVHSLEYDGEWQTRDHEICAGHVRVECVGGWTTVAGISDGDGPGVVLYQWQNGTPVVRRPLHSSSAPGHPVLVPDATESCFHMFWTNTLSDSEGQLMYGKVSIRPLIEEDA